jgi:hypothetical protein
MKVDPTKQVPWGRQDILSGKPERLLDYLKKLIRYLNESYEALANAINYNAANQAFVSDVVAETITVQNTTSKTLLKTFPIPANLLKPGAHFRIFLSGSYSNASTSDDWTMTFEVGGTTIETIARVGGNATERGWHAEFVMTVRTGGVTGNFLDYAFLVDGTQPYSKDNGDLHTLNMDQAEDISVCLQWDNAKTGNVFHLTQGYKLAIPG